MTARWIGLLLVGMGMLIMLGAALNWGIVSRPGKLFNRMFGDTVARIIYSSQGFTSLWWVSDGCSARTGFRL